LERPGTIALLVSASGTALSCLPTMAAALFYSGLWREEAQYMATADVLEPLRPVALGIQALGCFLGTRSRASRQGRLAILLPVVSWAAVIAIYYTRWMYTHRL
jgi:hypothetical protein